MAYHDRMQHMYLSAIGAMGQCIEEMKEVTASWVEETAALVERNAELENKATALVEVIAEVVAQAHENELWRLLGAIEAWIVLRTMAEGWRKLVGNDTGLRHGMLSGVGQRDVTG